MNTQKKEILSYICNELNKGEKLTPIRLQKYLYFAYSIWFTKQKNLNVSFENCSELFNNRFEAWKFGPVDVEVYNAYKNDFMPDHAITNLTEEKKKFLKEVWDRLLPYNDFQLVSISHNDIAWLNNYNERELFHANKILMEEIKSEYYYKNGQI